MIQIMRRDEGNLTISIEFQTRHLARPNKRSKSGSLIVMEFSQRKMSTQRHSYTNHVSVQIF